MSAFDSALRRIMTIPRDILQQAFMPVRYDPTRSARYYDNSIPLSLEATIIDQVVRGRVMKDMNLISGTMENLRLEDATAESVDNWNSIYRFNERSTAGRTITATYEVSYGYANNSISGPYGGYGTYSSRSSLLLKSARDILNAAGGNSPMSTSYVQIIGHNTVLINDVRPIQNYGLLRCLLSNDPNLNNLRPGYELPFAKICLLAVKAYVWTKLVIDMDEAMLRGGQQIGRFREVVDSYIDADQMYIESLDTFQAQMMLNDPQQARIINRLALGIRPKF